VVVRDQSWKGRSRTASHTPGDDPTSANTRKASPIGFGLAFLALSDLDSAALLVKLLPVVEQLLLAVVH
jgi:hypothetical protein